MIGRSLKERHGVLPLLPPDRAREALSSAMPKHGPDLVEVRKQGLIAVMVLDAHDGSIRLLESIGLQIAPGGSAVFGLAGPDAAEMFPSLNQRAWFEAPLGPKETRVVLVTAGLALVSIDVEPGGAVIRVAPDRRSN